MSELSEYRKETLVRFIDERMHTLAPKDELDRIERQIRVQELLEESERISKKLEELSLPEDYDQWKDLHERHSEIHAEEIPALQDRSTA